MNAMDVTEKILFERLYLVAGMGTLGLWVNYPYALTTPNVHCTTISWFLCNFFPEWPLIFLVITIHQVIWPSPVPSSYPHPTSIQEKRLIFRLLTNSLEKIFVRKLLRSIMQGSQAAWRTKPSSHHTLLGVIVPGNMNAYEEGAAQESHVGDEVFARRRGRDYFKGRISAITPQGNTKSAAIQFESGEFDPAVPARHVRGIEGQCISLTCAQHTTNAAVPQSRKRSAAGQRREWRHDGV